MTPRTVLVLAALAAAFSPSEIPAQKSSNQSDRLRESKLETYLARAQTALGRLEDELRDEHLDGARVAAVELHQALAQLEKARRSGGQASDHPLNTLMFDRTMFDRTTSRPSKSPENAKAFQQLFEGANRPKNENPFEELVRRNEQQQKKKDAEAPANLLFGTPPEKRTDPNPMRRLLELQKRGNGDPDPEAGKRILEQLLLDKGQAPADEPEKSSPKEPVEKRKSAARRPNDVMAAQNPPAHYRELEVGGQTVIVPEELLGTGGEVTLQGSQLQIRRGHQ